MVIGFSFYNAGQSLPEVLALVRARPNRYRSVEVKYGATQQGGEQREKSQGPDIAVCFPEHGTHLLFDSHQQRLRLIEVHDITRLQLRYGSAVFGGAAQPPTFASVWDAFGPTYPGEALAGQYPLQYPGVTFLFPQQPAAAAQPAGPASGELPVPLSTLAARVLVHHCAACSLAAARAAPPPPLPRGGAYFERVEAVPGQGLLLDGGGGGCVLRFGDCPQDVVTELGLPSSTATKPARPASPLPAAPAGGAAPADYWFCYAGRGLDALFCGATHRLRKLVLHANAPGHPDFGLYSKCNFRVHAPGSWSLPGASSEEAAGSPHSSEGCSSMKTAASQASLAATEAALPAGQGQGAAGGCHRGDAPAWAQRGEAGEAGEATGLTAAYNMLVGLIDDVIHIEGEGPAGAAAGSAAHPAPAQAAAAAACPVDKDGDTGSATAPPPGDGSVAAGGSGGAAALLGRPPRPPSLQAAPLPVVIGSSKSSKKKKKKERQRAAAARLLGTEGDDTDASYVDSAPSSLASSPGMTSFMSHIAATGGAAAHAPTRGAAHPISAYSSEGSTADFAGKERRMENGSAYDGWSEGEELALLVGEQAPPHAVHPGDVDAGRPARQGRLRVSAAVQTADGGGWGAELAAAPTPNSPDSFVVTDSPQLFDDCAVAAEYESVPRQRSSGTQTRQHMLSGPPLGAGGAAGAHPRRVAGALPARVRAAGVDGGLADIEAAFGPAKPALHARLGGRHPFGPTSLYAYRGVVFEVLRGGAIATVTLFQA